MTVRSFLEKWAKQKLIIDLVTLVMIVHQIIEIEEEIKEGKK